MKNFVYIMSILFVSLIFGCKSSTKPAVQNTETNEKFGDTIRIANEELEYEIMIIDPGFDSWYRGNAKPRGFHSQYYMESRNIRWVSEWNARAQSPASNPQRNLFEMPIAYESGINYGYEVNYLLYNYLVYFQLANNIRLGGYTPRP